MTHPCGLLRLGIDPKGVSERFEHSTIGTTLDTDSHVMHGMQKEAAGKVDAALSKSIKTPTRRYIRPEPVDDQLTSLRSSRSADGLQNPSTTS